MDEGEPETGPIPPPGESSPTPDFLKNAIFGAMAQVCLAASLTLGASCVTEHAGQSPLPTVPESHKKPTDTDQSPRKEQKQTGSRAKPQVFVNREGTLEIIVEP